MAETGSPAPPQRALLSESDRVSVYLESRPDGPVVVKVLTAPQPTDAELSRFLNELDVVQALAVPGVRRGVGRVRVDGCHGLELAYARGQTPEPESTVTPAAMAAVARTIAAAARVLASLHRCGYVHGSVEPGHLLLDAETGAVTLIGLAHADRLGRQPSPDEATNLPRNLTYASPEQTHRVNRVPDGRSDLYSLGVVLYELISGTPPFRMTDPLELVHAHLAVPPPLLAPRNVPAPLADIVYRLLSKEPDDRYQSADGLAHDLEMLAADLDGGHSTESFRLGARDASSTFTLPQVLYGRDGELDALTDRLDAAAAGTPQLVLLSGEAGAGKSALGSELIANAVASGALFARGKFEQLHRGEPFSAVEEALTALIPSLLALADDELGACRTRCVDAIGGNGQVLVDLVPAVERLIGPQPEVVELRGPDAANRRQHVVEAFVAALAGGERSLVLFIDDLQWADSASLDLIGALLNRRSDVSMLVLAAYRHDEVGPGHPVRSLLGRLESQPERVSAVRLGPLGANDLEDLVAAAMRSEPADVRDLAVAVHSRSSGNPFFARQLLIGLHEQGVISFDPVSASWQYRADQLSSSGTTDDVADLLTRRIERLPANSVHVLSTAAHIGTTFDAELIADVMHLPTLEVVAAADAAVTAGLLVATGDGEYAFAHDRVQAAAYARDPAKSAQLHRDIGRRLRQRDPDDVFGIAHQLNLGRPALIDDAERVDLIALDVTAGGLALRAGARDLANTVLSAAVAEHANLTTPLSPELERALLFSAAEAAYYVDDNARARELGQLALARSANAMERAEARRTLILAAIAQDQLAEALAFGVEALADLGERFPRKPTHAHIVRGLVATKAAIRGRDPRFVLELPEMTAEDKRLAMELMDLLAPAAFRSSSNLFPLLVFRMVVLSLRHGNSSVSPFGYAAYAISLAGVLGDIEGGQRFGRAAMELSDAYLADSYRSKVLFVWGNFLSHWTAPLQDSPPTLDRAMTAGLEAGSTFDAVWGAFYGLVWRFTSGTPLPVIDEQLTELAPVFARDEAAAHAGAYLAELVAELRGLGPEAEPQHTAGAASGDRTHECFRAALALQRCVLLGKPGGSDYAEAAEQLLDAVVAMPYLSFIAFYGALSRIDDVDRGASDLPHVRPAIRKSQRKLRKWAGKSAAHHAHRSHLLEAELARVSGNPDAARSAYDEAIAAARRSGMVHEEGLCLLRAAAFYRSLGNDVLVAAMTREADAAWQQWGAHGPSVAAAVGAKPVAAEHLDLESLLKAAGAITAELVLERLLPRLLSIMVENAGATRGRVFLLGDTGTSLQLAADLRVDGDQGVRPDLGVTVDELTDLYPPLIRYVQRTAETVVVDDARAHKLCPQTSDNDTDARSIACLPLKPHGRVNGVVYLEHEAQRAFIPERVEVLELLGAQASIALENAHLYEAVESSLAEQQRLTSAQRRFVPQEFLETLGRTSIAEVELGDAVQQDLTVLFTDMRAWTTHTEGMTPAESMAFVNEFLGHLEPAITANNGFVDSYIGDAVMALFPRLVDDAVTGALGMLDRLDVLNHSRAANGLPPIDIGVGINTGPVTLGTMGGAERIKCGVIGDAVNLASRVESLTKRYGATILLGDSSVEALIERDRFTLRMIDRVQVVGRTQPVTLYSVERDLTADLVALWQEALDLYYGRQFAAAERALGNYLAQGKPDKAADIFMARCQTYATAPPDDDWTGVEVLTEKS